MAANLCCCTMHLSGRCVLYQQHNPSLPVAGLQLGSSYLSMDTTPRVLRLDTFSKVLWVTGSPTRAHRTGAPCPWCWAVLDGWQTSNGFEAHLINLQITLRRQCEVLVQACERKRHQSQLFSLCHQSLHR
eukprot:c20704_g2_i6.p1 GENE.c20704_g2_i6~~c20704_g2_i6.p1  ORF type:complete len:130 (+),score=10.67 c20704_g2_i6:143-532(+)